MLILWGYCVHSSVRQTDESLTGGAFYLILSGFNQNFLDCRRKTNHLFIFLFAFFFFFPRNVLCCIQIVIFFSPGSLECKHHKSLLSLFSFALCLSWPNPVFHQRFPFTVHSLHKSTKALHSNLWKQLGEAWLSWNTLQILISKMPGLVLRYIPMGRIAPILHLSRELSGRVRSCSNLTDIFLFHPSPPAGRPSPVITHIACSRLHNRLSCVYIERSTARLWFTSQNPGKVCFERVAL